MRKLPAAAQEERRRQAIGLRRSGMTCHAIAAQVGLSRTGAFDIRRRFAAEGASGSVSEPRGRRPDERRLLYAAREAEVEGLIRRHTPDGLGLPFAPWSRAAVGAPMARRRGVEPAVRTDGKDPARRASPRGSRSGAPTGRTRRRCGAGCGGTTQPSWRGPDGCVAPSSGAARPACGPMTYAAAPAHRGAGGRTPRVRARHRRAGLSLISAVTDRAGLRWMAVDGAVNAPSLIRFLRRPIRDARRKVFLVLDRLKAHRARLVREWLAEHRAEIDVLYLPSHSPELGPDDGVNADLQQPVPREAPARDKQRLKRAAIGHMRRLSRMAKRIRSMIRHPRSRCAA